MASKKVTVLTEVVESPVAGSIFIGIDVHKRSYHVAVRSRDGGMETWVAPADPGSLIQKMEPFKAAIGLVAYEAGPTGFGLARALEEVGLPVAVVAPSRVPRPVAYGAKTDRLDCRRLAEYGAKGMLHPIAVPSEREEAERSLIRRRHDLVESIRRVKQRIRSHLLFLGVEEPKGLASWSRRSIQALSCLSLASAAGQTLCSLLRELEWLLQERGRVGQEMANIAAEKRHEEEIACLRSVPGVGEVVAATFRMEVYRPERFTRAEEVASYLGLAPVVRQSGESKGRAQLRPVGQKHLRSLLVEAAWRWKSKDAWANGWYRKLVARSGLPQKAITALARKLAIILWRLCVEKRRYEPAQAVA